ncbi:MAG: hypothetical protein JWO30_4025 [Fibrobacteres bacterium]|nr:hypothetical protein [Fibrobacterota bacterium]
MKSACLSKAAILTGLSIIAGYSGTWPDSLVNAILSNNHPLQRQLVESRPGQCVAVTGLKAVAMILQAKPLDSLPIQSRPTDSLTLRLRPGANSMGPWSVPAFEWALKPDFGDACYPTFEQCALDSTAPETFRMAVLNVMSASSKNLTVVQSSAMHTAMKSILSSSGNSTAMRAFILRTVWKAAESTYEQDYSPFLTTNDSTLREAAFQGLIQKINANGIAGNKEANKAIFASFKSLVSHPISQGQVRVIATIREDYSRDFLLEKCVGDPQKLAMIFIRDGDIRHAGLIAEAAKEIRAATDASALKNAVSQGIKDPGGTIDRLLLGSSGELEDGLTLLRVFPKNAASHASLITQTSESSNPELKAAAQEILPYLPTASN